ncbi:MAG: ribosomal subunit interface protein [Myxococcota bacterium]|jgi:ribosomal subunit interface protein
MLAVSFRNIRPRDEVRKRAEALYEKLERFLDPAADGRLVVEVDHNSAVVELVVTSQGDVLTAKDEDPDLRTALDRLFHTMEGQLRRRKGRRDQRRHKVPPPSDGFVYDQDGEE